MIYLINAPLDSVGPVSNFKSTVDIKSTSSMVLIVAGLLAGFIPSSEPQNETSRRIENRITNELRNYTK
jgi:hypothetical protein